MIAYLDPGGCPCDVPAQLQSEAAQLIGGEGVALISSTRLFDAGGQQLTGDAATHRACRR